MSDDDHSGAQAAAADQQPAPVVAPDRVETAVREWFARCICNSPVSRNVESINHVAAALDDLIADLRKD